MPDTHAGDIAPAPQTPVNDTTVKTLSRSRSTHKVAVRTPKKDAVLAQAVEVALESAKAVAHPRPIGEHLGFVMDSERIGTHYFASTDDGYVGWAWAVTVARIPRSRHATVCEVDMVPRDGALLAPQWIPWEDRLRPGDLSRDDTGRRCPP